MAGFRLAQVAALQAVMRTMDQPTLIILGTTGQTRSGGSCPRSRSQIAAIQEDHIRRVWSPSSAEQAQRFNAAVLEFLESVE